MRRLFLTHRGDLVSAVTASEARQLLAVAERVQAPGIAAIVESLGRSAFVAASLGENLRDFPVVIVTGRGALTGAVGCVLARHLSNRGVSVTVFAVNLPDGPSFPGLAAAGENQWRALLETGAPVVSSPVDLPRQAGLVVDALPALGPSMLDNPKIARICQWINHARQGGGEVLSLDIPCGIDATTGVVAEGALRPDRTVCLALPKTGLQGASCGEIVVADAGIPARAYRRIAIVAHPCVFHEGFLLPLQTTF
ncbi:NAD(P)H-hydrate epimerase [Alkalispirochaeta alkalica]|uniref:NAD(P)H-hydrate epimerase n=1 Tax=Alkalispirochaeta alkalica TaxID=46356 RepID=UPI0003695673|nr:NAD(P)H-hydrate epimerase [Alkalispirochaeta alkalica]